MTMQKRTIIATVVEGVVALAGVGVALAVATAPTAGPVAAPASAPPSPRPTAIRADPHLLPATTKPRDAP